MKRFSLFKSYTFLNLILVSLLFSCHRNQQRSNKLESPIKLSSIDSSKKDKSKRNKKIIYSSTDHPRKTLSETFDVDAYGLIDESSLSKPKGKEPLILHSSEVIEESYDLEVDGDYPMETAPSRLKLSSTVGSIPESNPGTLTAGEVNDFTKWDMWKDISDNLLNSYKSSWKIAPQHRYTVQVKNKGFNNPIIDAKVKLMDGNELIFESRTDNTGKAELWYALNELNTKERDNLNAIIEFNGATKRINNLKPFKKGINYIELEFSCGYADIIDINFVVDATGSMGDEIKYLQTELVDVIKQIKNKRSDLIINLGSVFYKDHTDDYVTKAQPFKKNTSATIDFIKSQHHSGGGDHPEALDEALLEATEMIWSKNARARILFLVMDAPSHKNPEHLDRLNKAISIAAKKGIRIVPVAGSGIQKDAEYLMRSLALATNGTYVFLTDDSGVGGSHIKPSTDSYDVEKLNDLLIRLVIQYTEIPKCEQVVVSQDENDTLCITYLESKEINYSKLEEIINGEYQPIDKTEDIDSNTLASTDSSILIIDSNDVKDNFKPELKIYPNPTTGPTTIELKGEFSDIYLRDITGKIISRWAEPNSNTIIDVSKFPSGIYFVTCPHKNKWLSTRLVIVSR